MRKGEIRNTNQLYEIRVDAFAVSFHYFSRFFSLFFAAKRHQICPQERKRTPKELRASRSVTTAKIHTQRPGRAKTVAREREPLRLRRLHRTVCFARLLRTSRKTGRTYTASRIKRRGFRRGAPAGKGPRRGPRRYNATATLQPPRGAGGARDFSENPRWGPYKNHKNVTKN